MASNRFELEVITTFQSQGLDATVARIKSELAQLAAPTLSVGGTGGALNPGAAAAQIKQLNDARIQAERAIQQLQASAQITSGPGSQAAELRRQITAQYTDLSKDPNFIRLQQQANKVANPPQLFTSTQQVQAAVKQQEPTVRPTAGATETAEPATTAQLAKAQEARVKQAAEVTREALAETDLARYTAELASARKDLQAQVASQLTADSDYTKATVELATARSRLKTSELEQSGPGTAAFDAKTQKDVAQRTLNAQSRIAANAEADIALQADLRVSNEELAAATKKLANERAIAANGGSQIGEDGTVGQRLAAYEKKRPDGGVVDPLQQQTFGQQFLQLGVRTAGYAISGTALFALADALKSTIKETTQLDYQFGLLKEQTDALGQGNQFGNLKSQILEIARQTGVSGQEVANVAYQLQGAFQSATVAAQDTRAAMELVRTTGLSVEEITNDLTAVSVAYGQSFSDIGDKVTALQTRYGVMANQSVQAFGIVGAAAKDAGLTFDQTAEVIGAIGRASGSSATQIGNNLNTILPSLQHTEIAVEQVLQGATKSVGGKAPQLSEDDFKKILGEYQQGQTGAALFQILEDQQKFDAQTRNNLATALSPRPQLTATVQQLFSSAPQILAGANSNDAGALQNRFDALSKTLPQELSRLGEIGRQLGMALLHSGLLDALKLIAAGMIGVADVTLEILKVFTTLNDLSGHTVTDILAVAAAVFLLQKALKGLQELGGLGTLILNSAGLKRTTSEVNAATEAVDAASAAGGVAGTGNAAKTGSSAARDAEIAAGVGGAAKLGSEAEKASKEVSGFTRAMQSAGKFLATFGASGITGLGVGLAGRSGLGGIFAEGSLAAGALGGAATLGVLGAGAYALNYDVSTTQKLKAQADVRKAQIDAQLSLPAYSPQALATIATDPSLRAPAVKPFGFLPSNRFIDPLAGVDSLYQHYVTHGDVSFGSEAARLTPSATQAYAQAAQSLNLFSGPQADLLNKLVQQMQSGKGNKASAAETRRLLGSLTQAQQQQVAQFIAAAKDQQQTIQSDGQVNLDNISDATARYQSGQETFSQYLDDLNKQVGALTSLAGSPTGAKALLQGLQQQQQVVQAAQQQLQQNTQAGLSATGANPSQTFYATQNDLIHGPGGINSYGSVPLAPGRVDPTRLKPVQQTALLGQLEALQAAGSQALAQATQNGATPDQIAQLQSVFSLPPDKIELLQHLQELLFGKITDTGSVKASVQELLQSNQNAIAKATAQAQTQIAGLYNPSAINQTNASLAQQQLSLAQNVLNQNPNDPQAQLAVDQAKTAIAQAGRQQADTNDQIAQSRIQLQQAIDSQNPVKSAQDQIAAGNLALAQSRGNVAAANAARAQIAAGNFAQQQANEAVANAKIALLKAQNPLDALKQAQLDQRAADVAAQYAVGQAAQLQAQAQRSAADKSVQDALEAIAQSQYDVLVAQANQTGDVVKAAELNVQKAQQSLQNARSRGAGTAELNALQVQVTQAQSQATETSIQTQEQLIQFNLNMQKITLAQAVAAYQGLLKQATTPQDQMQIEQQIHDWQQAAGQDLQYNLPTDLGLPTLYTARRLLSSPIGTSAPLAPGLGGSSQVSNDNRIINITLNEATDGQQAVQTIVNALSAPPTTGNYARLY